MLPQANVSKVPALSKYEGRCEPAFLFMKVRRGPGRGWYRQRLEVRCTLSAAHRAAGRPHRNSKQTSATAEVASGRSNQPPQPR